MTRRILGTYCIDYLYIIGITYQVYAACAIRVECFYIDYISFIVLIPQNMT